jgi:hypothetical protein
MSDIDQLAPVETPVLVVAPRETTLPDREIDDPPTQVERAPTEPPPAVIDVAPPAESGVISERASELHAQLDEIVPPALAVETVGDTGISPPAQAELTELWNALGQLGVAFTEISTRVAKLEKFIGLKP